MSAQIDLSKIEGFEWNEGNAQKNEIKHNVSQKECEEIFFNKPFVIFEDEFHSGKEKRLGILSKTDRARKLTIFFTIRVNKIRVISARDQSKKDKLIYEKALQKKQAEKGKI